MGGQNSRFDIAAITPRLVAKTGKIAFAGRYHKAPKSIHDDYELTDTVLGSGMDGVVRLATRKDVASSSQKKFAVKSFQRASVAREKRAQLQMEAEIFLCMDHPHVARLFDVYDSDEYLFFVMECMEGGEVFDRLAEVKKFSERCAADTLRQMLLAVKYLHDYGMVHRDLKPENFLYDREGSSHLKLIDFGLSSVWDPNMKMRATCGTLSYVAPEVLQKSYTSQCDLWSLGVIAFLLMSGYMPFSGSDAEQMRDIAVGRYLMKKERWSTISDDGKNFMKSLLQVTPSMRLTAGEALEHAWIKNRERPSAAQIDASVVEALRGFGKASKFRRCCLGMMAWSLSNEERANVRDYFMEIDKEKNGMISLAELKNCLEERFSVPEEETRAIFAAMDSNHDEKIHYSDFLAAMVSTRIAMHDDLLLSAFKKFDADGSGYITVDDLREVLGDSFDGAEVEKLLEEADLLEDNRISYEEFVCYLRGEPLVAHVASHVIDSELKRVNSKSSSSKLHVELPSFDHTSDVERPLLARRKSERSPVVELLGPRKSVILEHEAKTAVGALESQGVKEAKNAAHPARETACFDCRCVVS